ncbi:AdoMet_MTases domain containing protein [uncultured Caudovirales phage]|uniref:AdoMet_MTases domain containing protein n=1 Tax=uncultured Caudovirales phage TaxID=2100421 RepID=A0A6J5RD03_9CAUD|nr:AdoMet_MTases domain containing protein [uncultured Caudovirales phage]
MREAQIGNCRLIHGDCLHVLPELDEDSVDTIITDPPYGLSFMGRDWDHGIPGVPFWEAALRVAKPGAMLLAFGGTRTFHRLACAIEDAGWELRDTIMYVYGTGFPKSLDISKAIDKAAGVERAVIGSGVGRTGSSAQPNGSSFSDDSYQWPGQYDITAPATDAAKTWSGYGTALKPAFEPIIVAMKPIDGTFANNAIKHGVAGLNIDGSRIELNGDYKCGANGRPSQTGLGDNYDPYTANRPSNIGRFPANLIHDGSDEVVSMFPSSASSNNQAGIAVARSGEPSQDRRYTDSGGTNFAAKPGARRIDGGSAARFFYCAKASSSERGDFNTHPTVKPLALMEYLCKLTKTPTGGTVLDMFMGSGSTGVACVNTGRSFVGIEREDTTEQPFFTITTKRIQDAVLESLKPKSRDLFGDDE